MGNYKATPASFKPGDPRAVAGGLKSRRGPASSKSQQAVEDFLKSGLVLPEGHVPPSTAEIQGLARSLVPATLAFASSVIGDDKVILADRFAAARILMQLGGAAMTADNDEIAKLARLLESLQTEHRETLAAARNEHAAAVTALAELKVSHAALSAETEALRQDRDRLSAALEAAHVRNNLRAV